VNLCFHPNLSEVRPSTREESETAKGHAHGAHRSTISLFTIKLVVFR